MVIGQPDFAWRNGLRTGQARHSLQTLKAMSIDAAFQYIKEGSKGLLERGALAELITLNKNPIKADPPMINEGKTIYRAK